MFFLQEVLCVLTFIYNNVSVVKVEYCYVPYYLRYYYLPFVISTDKNVTFITAPINNLPIIM